MPKFEDYFWKPKELQEYTQGSDRPRENVVTSCTVKSWRDSTVVNKKKKWGEQLTSTRKTNFRIVHIVVSFPAAASIALLIF